MSYLLRFLVMARARLPSGCTSIVSGLSNAEDMTRSKFLKRGLKRVVQKHRNGGVHDSPTPEEVCRECVEVLVGNSNEPGYLPIVAAWKLWPRPEFGDG